MAEDLLACKERGVFVRLTGGMNALVSLTIITSLVINLALV